MKYLARTLVCDDYTGGLQLYVSCNVVGEYHSIVIKLTPYRSGDRDVDVDG